MKKGPSFFLMYSSLIACDCTLLESTYLKAPITSNIKKGGVHEMGLSIQAHPTVILPSRIQKDLLLSELFLAFISNNNSKPGSLNSTEAKKNLLNYIPSQPNLLDFELKSLMKKTEIELKSL